MTLPNLSHSFDDVASNHEKHTRKHWLKRYFYKSLVEKFLLDVDPKPNEKIIELACGNGYYGGLCLEKGADVHFMDINESMLSAVQRLYGAKVKDKTHQGDIRKLSFADQTFDKTLCFGAFPPLPTLEDVEMAIREFVRITKPGGKVYFTYNPPHPLRYISVRYWRIHSKLFNSSLKNLPFIDGRTSGTHTDEQIEAILKKINKPYIKRKAGTGVFGTICISV